MIAMIAQFFDDEAGATSIEYGLIAVIVCLGIMMGLTALSTAMNTKYDSISSAVVATGS